MKKLLSAFLLTAVLTLGLTACSIPGLGNKPDDDDSNNNNDDAVCEHTEMSAWQTTKAATCTEDGEQERHCLSEGCEYKEKGKINKLGHDEIIHPQLDATCTETGLSSYKTCSRCDYATEPTVIEKIAHTPGAWKTVKAPTCYADGQRQKSCTVCDAVVETGTITTTVKHRLGAWEEVTAPTCTTAGERKKSCTNEGCTYILTDEIDALGHDLDEGVVTTPATCTEDGVMTYTCENGCGHTETGVIDALDHDLKDAAGKAANCTEAGYTDYKACSRCDYIEGKEPIAPLGHSGDEFEIITEATCTTAGLQNGICGVCGVRLENSPIPALGHDMGDYVATTPATCIAEGVATATCKRADCGHTETKPIPVADHTLGEWVNIDAYTQKNECTVCDYTETRTDPDAPSIVYGKEYLHAWGDMGTTGKLVAGRADINTNKHLIFTANVTSFAGLRVGHGYADYTSAYLEIDGTSVKYYQYNNGSNGREHILMLEKTHGLTISGDIKVTIDVNEFRVATIKIESDSDSFSFTTNTNWYGSNGEIYAQSLGSVFTDAQLAFTCDGYADDFHIYGDSYLSQGSTGWLRDAFLAGYTDGVFDGYGGRGSAGAIASLIENLKHSSPKIVVWMLGMNDGSDLDIDTPSNAWATNRDKLIALSEEYGFELVFTTIPTVPTIYHEGKNKWIRESGYRYIDMAAGLGADGTGAWTEGYLGNDKIHPSASGAKAIYAQVAKDFPELVDKCYHVVTDWSFTDAPTCTEGGEREGACTKCGETITEAVEALGHNLDDGEITTAPGCTTEGEILYRCQACIYTTTETVQPNGHNRTDSVVVTAPTCTSEGVMSSTCLTCGDTVTDTIEKLKHNIGAWATVAGGARERRCSGCDYKETDYIISFDNGLLATNDRFILTPGAAVSGAEAPEAVGPTSTTAGSISTRLEIRDNVAGKVGNFVLFIKVDPSKAGSYGTTTATVNLTNDNTTGKFLMFEMDFKNMSYTNSGGPILFSITIGENTFSIYPKYGTSGNYGKGLNFGVGGRNILFNNGAYNYTADGDTSYVLPCGEWITLRLVFDIEAGEMKTYVKSSKTNDLMTLVATTNTTKNITKVGDITQETAVRLKTNGLDTLTDATITFNDAVGGLNSAASENAYDNISFMRMDYAECPHTNVSDWETKSEPTCDVAGRLERRCLNEECGYVEVKETPAKGHTLGSWYDIGNNTVQRDCENCDYNEQQSVLGYTPKATLMSLKGGANSVVVLIHDDGYVASMEFADRMFTKYGLVGDVAMMVDNVMNGANYRDAYIPFKYYLSNGNWGLINHSYTHSYWGTIQYAADGTTVIGVTPDEAKIYREVVTSAEKLRELFPGHRVLTFAYPGISKISNPLGFNTLYNEIRKVVDKYCIAGRNYAGGPQSISGISWDMTNCGTLSDANAATVIKEFENFAYGESKISVYLSHGIADGQNLNINAENFEAVCAALKTYVDEGTIWNAHYEDAALYIRETESATLTVEGDIDEIKLTLTDELDNSIYNYPLTVRLEVPYSFAAVKVTQGDRTTYALAKDADGKWVCDVEVVPDGGVASVTKIAVSDIPETPDEPTVTPPTDEEEDEDDGLAINASTDFSKSNGLTTDVYSSIAENFDAIHASVVKYEKATNASGSGRNTSWVPANEALADAMEASFDIYIDKAGTVANGMAFQVYFATVKTTPFTAVIKTEANGFSFGALSSANGGSTTYCTSTLAYDTWHTVTIKINMSSNEHFKATFYADGNEIGSSKVFTNYDKVADAVVNRTVRGIYFQSNSSAKTLMYLDNMSLKAGTLEAMGLPVHGEYHFESSLQNVANSKGFLTPSLSKIGENKTQSLQLVKQIGADSVSFYPNLNTAPITPEAFSLSLDLYVGDSAAVGASNTIAKLYFNSDAAKSPYTLDLVKGTDGFGFGGDVASEATLEYNKWHTVKLVVKNDISALYAELFVEDTLVGKTEGVTADGRENKIDGVFVGGDNDSSFTLYLDNLTFKSGTKDEVFDLFGKYGIDLNYFPGWTRKSLTFSLDDGILANDEKVLNILRPAGILGTFNLYGVNVNDAERYRELYKGYGIANHCNYHALFFDSQKDYNFTDEPWPGAATADQSLVYKHPTVEGLYYYFVSGYSWHPLADVEHYLEFAMQTEKEIEQIFGEGVVKGFIYPNGTPSANNENLKTVVDFLKANGYTNIRRTYPLMGTNFSLPADRYNWSYNADHTNILSTMKAYEALADDGELKFFSFGVHAIDYLNTSKATEGSRNPLENLYIFARTYGYRPDDYYYATVEDIFEYEDAIKAVTVEGGAIQNNSDITIYVKVGGEKITIDARCEYVLETGDIVAIQNN